MERDKFCLSFPQQQLRSAQYRMHLYITHDNQPIGPFPLEEVKAALADGRISLSDMAWHEGLADWTPLGEIPGVYIAQPPHLPQPLPPIIPDNSPQGMPPVTPTQPRGKTVDAQASAKQCKKADWSLRFGIVGVVPTLLCVFFAIPAAILGHKALKEIKTSGNPRMGRRKATTGLILGYIGIFLFIVMDAPSMMSNFATPTVSSTIPSEGAKIVVATDKEKSVLLVARDRQAFDQWCDPRDPTITALFEEFIQQKSRIVNPLNPRKLRTQRIGSFAQQNLTKIA